MLVEAGPAVRWCRREPEVLCVRGALLTSTEAPIEEQARAHRGDSVATPLAA